MEIFTITSIGCGEELLDSSCLPLSNWHHPLQLHNWLLSPIWPLDSYLFWILLPNILLAISLLSFLASIVSGKKSAIFPIFLPHVCYVPFFSVFKIFSLSLVISSNEFIRDSISDREGNDRYPPNTSHCYPVINFHHRRVFLVVKGYHVDLNTLFFKAMR